jgi:serine/threonine-protein kinase RsbW
MTEGPAGYPLAIMTDSTFSAGVADADFACVDTADAQTVSRLRHELSRWLRTHFVLDPIRLNDVLLAVNEALTNAAEFAYPRQRGTMALVVRYDVADGALVIDVSDHGRWRHVDPAAQPNTRGRGIPLMRALSDRLTISRLPKGTHVQLQFGDCTRVAAGACATPA